MFPESFAEKWIGRLTKRGQVVLDPFCGRGTAPFQVVLMERGAVGSDVNPVAYCVSKAKTCAPALGAVRRRLTVLEKAFDSDAWEKERKQLPPFFRVAYKTRTLRQIVYLRHALRWARSDTDCMIAALVLGALHGESNTSPSYLSNQMPRTISTKPAYSIRFWQYHGYVAPRRDAFELLRRQAGYRYASRRPARRASILQMDMRDLPRAEDRLPRPLRCVITSPPYLDVTNCEEDQWLRLWFLGGPPHPTYGRVSRDDRHERPEAYWRMIADMWRCLGVLLDAGSDVVVRIGGKGQNPDQVIKTLTASAAFAQRKVSLAHGEASAIQRRQTDSFRPGSTGCRFEVDCYFKMK